MQRHDGNDIAFDGIIADCDVCAVGKSQQQLIRRKLRMPTSPGLSSFATATSWALSPQRPTGVSNTSARSHTSSPGGPSSTCWRTKASHSTPFACSSHQQSSLAADELFAGVPKKEGNARAKRSSSITWKRASPRHLRPPTHLSQMACPSALYGPFAVRLAAF